MSYKFIVFRKYKPAIFQPKKPAKCKVNCSVPECNSTANKDRNLSFHLFSKVRAVKVGVKNDFENRDARLANSLVKKVKIWETLH